MRFIKILNLFLSLFLLHLSLEAQSPYFKSYPILKGRPECEVKKFFQDSNGYLWFSTTEGLFRFNGVEFQHFNGRDSIAEALITAISEDKSGEVWVGYKNGELAHFNGLYFEKFVSEEGNSSSEISDIFFDSNGTLWFSTVGEGVYYFIGKNRKRLYNISTDDGLSDNYTYSISEAPTKELFIGTDNGISTIDMTTRKVTRIISMKNGLPDNIVRHIEINGDKLWVGMDEGGLCIYDINRKNFDLLFPWNFGTINTFHLRSGNECWVSTKSSGLVQISWNRKNYSIRQFTINNGLPSNETYTVFSDREMNIWAGYKNKIVLAASTSFEFLDKQHEAFDFGNVFAFLVDNKGKYWAATERGLTVIEKDSTGHFSHVRILEKNSMKASSFISLYQDSDGFIWAGTYGYGAYKINSENCTYQVYTTSNGLPDNNIISITGNKNEIWFATLGGGAAKLNLKSKKIEVLNQMKGLGSNYVYNILCSSDGKVWFAIDGGGVSVLENGRIISKFLPDSLGINTVYSIIEDKENQIWILTADKGVYNYTGDKYYNYSVNNGLKTNNIRSITNTKYGDIIFASNEAIQIYYKKARDFENYGEESGVAYLEPNLNAIYLDKNGSVWIAGQLGVIKYDPVTAEHKNVMPLISITRKLLFSEPIQLNKSVFSHNQNHLSFEYSGFWYQSAENLVYRYKLENYDYDWSRPTKNRSVTYSNLPPGNYIFKVEVSHKPGIWVATKNCNFSFRVKPPFYKTWWFDGLTILLIISGILSFIRWRIIKLKRDKEHLEHEVKKRTATIMLQKEEIEAQRDEIEAQRDFVIKQRDQIALQNDHIRSGIEYASRIQKAIMPPEEDFELRLHDFFILNRPMDIVSGDFYWISSAKHRIFVVAADCTGHGVSGAFMSILGVSLLNKIVNTDPDISAARTLNLLRDEIKYTLRQTGKAGEAQDGMDIALVILENDRKNYQYAGANNDLYIIRRGGLIKIAADHMPIGIYLDEHSFTNNTGNSETGDMFYLFSDGYSDQFGGSKEGKFKAKNFQELLLKISQLPLSEQLKELNATMDKWKHGLNQNDDILVIGFRI